MLSVRRVNYLEPGDARALVLLLDAYARDPMGGGEGLSEDVKARLCSDLAACPAATSFIAWQGEQAGPGQLHRGLLHLQGPTADEHP